MRWGIVSLCSVGTVLRGCELVCVVCVTFVILVGCVCVSCLVWVLFILG